MARFNDINKLPRIQWVKMRKYGFHKSYIYSMIKFLTRFGQKACHSCERRNDRKKNLMIEICVQDKKLWWQETRLFPKRADFQTVRKAGFLFPFTFFVLYTGLRFKKSASFICQFTLCCGTILQNCSTGQKKCELLFNFCEGCPKLLLFTGFDLDCQHV